MFKIDSATFDYNAKEVELRYSASFSNRSTLAGTTRLPLDQFTGDLPTLVATIKEKVIADLQAETEVTE